MFTTSHSPVVTASAPSPASFRYGPPRSTLAHCSPCHHAVPSSPAAPTVQPPSASGSATPLAVAGAIPPPPSFSSSASTTSSSTASASALSSSHSPQLPRRQSHQKLFSSPSSGPSSSPHHPNPASGAPSAHPSSRIQYVLTEPTSSSSSHPENREMVRPDSTLPHPPASQPSGPGPITSTPSPSLIKQQLNSRSPVKRRNPGTAPPGPRTAGPSTASNTADHPSASGQHSSTCDPDSPSKRARAETRPKVLPLRYETMVVEDLVVLISHMLGELIATNDPMALTSGRLTRFHSRTAPGISVRDYLHRIAKHATLTPAVLLSMVYYIDRLCSLYPEFTINTLTVHRFLITAATVGAKGLSDSFWNNTTYARVGGVRVQELKTLELEFLNRVDWKIVPQPEVLVAYYKGLIKRCPDYVLEEEPESSSAPATTCNNDSSSDESHRGNDSTEISEDDDSGDAEENPQTSRAQSEVGISAPPARLADIGGG